MSLIINQAFNHLESVNKFPTAQRGRNQPEHEFDPRLFAIVPTLVSSASLLAALAPRVISNSMDTEARGTKLRICNSPLAKVLLFSPATLRYAQALHLSLENEDPEKLDDFFSSVFVEHEDGIDYGKTMMKLLDVIERPQLIRITSSVITQGLFKLSASTNIFREQIVPNKFQFLHTPSLLRSCLWSNMHHS